MLLGLLITDVEAPAFSECFLFTIFFFSGNPRKLAINTYPAGSGVIWLDDVVCYGNETSIDDCRHQPIGTSNCRHGEDVAIACDSSKLIYYLFFFY